MNSDTSALLFKMIELLSQHEQHKISLRQLVDGLEATYLSMGTAPSPEFKRLWFEHWGELEIWVAMAATETVPDADVEHASSMLASIAALKELVKTQIARQ